MGKYDEIINLNRPESNHPKMDIIKRSAQFAPFSALNGYEDEIKETGRFVDFKKELSEDEIENISKALNIIEYYIKEKPFVKVTYFVKDKNKNGGKYVIKEGNVKIIDMIKKNLVFTDKEIIKIENIKEINGKIIDRDNY